MAYESSDLTVCPTRYISTSLSLAGWEAFHPPNSPQTVTAIIGAAERNRTPNLRITKPLLYLLSYDGSNGQFDDQSSDSWMIAAPA